MVNSSTKQIHFSKPATGLFIYVTWLEESCITEFSIFLAGQTGCLQLVRTGCGVSVIHSEDDPESELKEAGHLWAIKECFHDTVDHVMVVSFTLATRALGIGNVTSINEALLLHFE